MNIIFLGYEGKIGYGFIMSSIFFSFVMNIIFIIYYLLKKIMNKTKKKFLLLNKYYSFYQFQKL